MMFDEVAESRGFEKTQLAQKDAILMHPIVVSSIKDQKISQDLQPLAHLPNDGSIHRVRISVANSSALEAAKCIKLKDSKTGALTNATKGAVPKGKELVTCVAFLVKDTSTFSSNHFTKVNLVDNGSFFNLKPKEIQQDDNKLRSVVQMLERFNVWLEASIQKKNGQFYITDATTMKKYDWVKISVRYKISKQLVGVLGF